jgi:hypothetical protein
MRPKDNVEPVEGVEAAGDGCDTAEGDSRCEDGECIAGGDAIGAVGGTGGCDTAGGGVLPAHVDVLFVGDNERSG